MKCIKHNITSRFPKLGIVKELKGACEFNEKLTINQIIKKIIIIILKQSPFPGKSLHSAAIFATPTGSSYKTKSNLNEWGNPEISRTAC